MFKNVTDNGFLSILHSCVKRPLSLWDKKIRSGHVKRVMDHELQSLVLEVTGSKINNTYITCPANLKKTLGVRFPVLVITVKNINRFFAFDVQILDDNNVRRRFRVSTLTVHPDVRPFTCKLPLVLADGWNQVLLPLQEFTMRAYGTNYLETLRIQIYPNCRIQRIYFTNKLFVDDHSEGKIYYTILNGKQSLTGSWHHI